MKPPSGPALPGLAPPSGGVSLTALDPRAVLADAIQAHEAGRPAEAERGYRLAATLAPRDAGTLAHLGVLLLEQGRHEEGEAVLARSIALDPQQRDMLTNRGNALVELGRIDQAFACYADAIALQPEAARAEAFGAMAAYLQGLGHTAFAMRAYDQAIALDPRGADWRTHRGVAFYRAGDLAAALADFDASLTLNPDGPEIHNNRGLVLQGLDRLDEALKAADRAVALQPGTAENHNNRGLALQALGRFEDAVAAYDQAAALNPDYAEPRWNKALVLLLLGDDEGGLPLFEWRWRRRESPPPPDLGRPPWLGEESVAGKTLLLHAEQGLGDTIQMLRYVPLLAAQSARVVLGVQPPLIDLARSVAGVDALVREGDPLAFDLHCPLMSLPLAMGGAVPGEAPYLAAPPAKVEAWRARLGPRGRRRIGLVWSGNAAHNSDRHRSIPLETLLPLLDADADFVSLQTEYRPADAAVMRADGRIRDVAEALADFTDTAALIDNLDLAVCVDTSVAHLAGALGKPVFILLPHIPDYRWRLRGARTPWYPTARLFRQARAGDWSAVVADVREALA